MIPFPGPKQDKEEQRTETVRLPKQVFTIDNYGRVDLVDGIEVSDAVEAFWSALQGVVKQAWDEGPAEHERARVRLLVALLDRHVPGWRFDVKWED